ncbi:MAG: hypothetical protein ACFBSF_19050 [Leptolyngbyaceae cyanobacterium]
MYIDLIELFPHNTRNRLWLSEIFQCSIRRFDGFVKANMFPIFIVQGSKNCPPEERSIQFQLFPSLNEVGQKFGLIHIMDENYDHDISAYHLDECSMVFREYLRPSGGRLQLLKDYGKSFYRPIHNSQYSGLKLFPYKIYARFARFRFLKDQHLPTLSENSIFHIPLGYTDRFAKTKKEKIPSMSERNYKWSFCGDSFKSDRNLMLKTLRNVQPNFIYEYRGFMGEQSLSGEDYWEVLTRSMFAPCPLGNVNIDTYRIFEVLEAKAIPIILKGHTWQPYDYYASLFGRHPIPTFQSWKSASIFLNEISLESTEELAVRVSEWYKRFKTNLKVKIQEMLQEMAQSGCPAYDISCFDSYARYLQQ